MRLKLKNVTIIFFIISIFACQSAYAQQNPRNKRERVYGNDTIISDEPLPDKVYQAHKNDIAITIYFFAKEKDKREKTGLFRSMGNGSVIKPGIIITARHVLTEGLAHLEEIKKEHLNSGIVAEYSYEILGSIVQEEQEIVNIPLSLRAYENLRSERDLMVLEVLPEAMKKVIQGAFVGDNISKLLLTTAKLTEDVNAGDDVWIVGTLINYIDIPHFVFKCEVGAKLENMTNNMYGLKRLYRLNCLRGHAEPGYSGGPILNKDGDIVGITVMVSHGNNFVYAISAKDIKDFLRDNNIR